MPRENMKKVWWGSYSVWERLMTGETGREGTGMRHVKWREGRQTKRRKWHVSEKLAEAPRKPIPMKGRKGKQLSEAITLWEEMENIILTTLFQPQKACLDPDWWMKRNKPQALCMSPAWPVCLPAATEKREAADPLKGGGRETPLKCHVVETVRKHVKYAYIWKSCVLKW